nr:PREDICTED: apoptosis-stimulating of p53 protein 2-like [Bemisia tabaci]
MVPMIVRIFVEGEPGCEDVAEVPVTPATTCRDVIECVRDPGDEICTLVETWAPKCERILQDDERPLEILQEWGQQQDKVKLILRYSIPRFIKGGSPKTSNGMKEPGLFSDSVSFGFRPIYLLQFGPHRE